MFINVTMIYGTTEHILLLLLYQYGNVYQRHHDLPNYWTDIFKAYIFRKFKIRHWLKSPLSLLIILKKMFLTKSLTLNIDNAASAGNNGKLTYFIYFHKPQLEAALLTSKRIILRELIHIAILIAGE